VKVKVLEAGGSAGGTWYWSKFPSPVKLVLLTKPQIDIPAQDSIASLTPTASSFPKNFLTNGSGQSISHRKKKQNGIFNSSAINISYGMICNLTLEWRRRNG